MQRRRVELVRPRLREALEVAPPLVPEITREPALEGWEVGRGAERASRAPERVERQAGAGARARAVVVAERALRQRRDVRIPAAVGVLLGAVEEQQVGEVCELPRDGPGLRRGHQFDRQRPVRRRLHRHRVEREWRACVHA